MTLHRSTRDARPAGTQQKQVADVPRNSQVHSAIPPVQAYAKMLGIEIREGDQVVFLYRREQRSSTSDSQRLQFRTAVVGNLAGLVEVKDGAYQGDRTIFYRSTKASRVLWAPVCTWASNVMLAFIVHRSWNHAF